MQLHDLHRIRSLIERPKYYVLTTQGKEAYLGGGGTVGQADPHFSMPTPYFVTLAR